MNPDWFTQHNARQRRNAYGLLLTALLVLVVCTALASLVLSIAH